MDVSRRVVYIRFCGVTGSAIPTLIRQTRVFSIRGRLKPAPTSATFLGSWGRL
jgi:hypothetical protein